MSSDPPLHVALGPDLRRPSVRLLKVIHAQFNGTRCLLQGNVLINRRYLSLASLLLPMTVAMTLSQ